MRYNDSLWCFSRSPPSGEYVNDDEVAQAAGTEQKAVREDVKVQRSFLDTVVRVRRVVEHADSSLCSTDTLPATRLSSLYSAPYRTACMLYTTYSSCLHF